MLRHSLTKPGYPTGGPGALWPVRGAAGGLLFHKQPPWEGRAVRPALEEVAAGRRGLDRACDSWPTREA